MITTLNFYFYNIKQLVVNIKYGLIWIESIVKSQEEKESINNYIPDIVKVISSEGKESLNEGTLSKYGNADESFYTCTQLQYSYIKIQP